MQWAEIFPDIGKRCIYFLPPARGRRVVTATEPQFSCSWAGSCRWEFSDGAAREIASSTANHLCVLFLHVFRLDSKSCVQAHHFARGMNGGLCFTDRQVKNILNRSLSPCAGAGLVSHDAPVSPPNGRQTPKIKKSLVRE